MNKTQALALARKAFGVISYGGPGRYYYTFGPEHSAPSTSIVGTYQQTLSRRAVAIVIQALILMGYDDKIVMLECYDITHDVGSAAKRLNMALVRLEWTKANSIVETQI